MPVSVKALNVSYTPSRPPTPFFSSFNLGKPFGVIISHHYEVFEMTGGGLAFIADLHP